jgi:SAM-dependent methyltransferase
VSLERLLEHRRVWQAKPLLRDVYQVWFDALLTQVPPGGRVLEPGAGPGLMAEYAREHSPELRWVAADILPAPWNDLAADGLRLPFREGTFDAVVMLDVVHHLARPARFFAEAARVLRPGAPLAVVEPWVTPFSYPIYRWLHEEGCRLSRDPWAPFSADVGEPKDAFEGDASVVWGLVRRTPAARWAELGFGPPRVEVLNGFAHLASLGFARRALLPRALARPLVRLDAMTRVLAPVTGLRALAVWKRTGSE